MVTVISEKIHKARKEKKCDLCLCKIEVGQEYIRQFNVHDEPFTFRMHPKCSDIAHKLVDFRDLDDGGCNSTDFYYAIRYDYCRIKGVNHGLDSMSDMLEVVLNHHGI